ncbi:MAG: conjugal transfer protein TrbI, partial [Sphingobacteriaceae bacterium]
LENSINIPPTMYKNQGDIIGIMVGRDIDFSKIYTLKIDQ